jgi:hypothetical protein
VGFDSVQTPDGGVDTTCGPWSAPRRLAELAVMPNDQYGPSLSSDRLEVLYSIDYLGLYVYRARRTALDQPFGASALVGFGSSQNDPFVTADGLAVYFEWSGLQVATRTDLTSEFANDRSVDAINAGGLVKNPALTGDELTMVFDSDRGIGGRLQPFLTTRSSTADMFGWTVPVRFDALDGPGEESHVTFAGDGSFLLFASDRASPGVLHVYRSDFIAGAWTVPVPFAPTIGSDGFEADPYLTPDTRTLLFSSSRTGSTVGGSNLYEMDRECP